MQINTCTILENKKKNNNNSNKIVQFSQFINKKIKTVRIESKLFIGFQKCYPVIVFLFSKKKYCLGSYNQRGHVLLIVRIIKNKKKII